MAKSLTGAQVLEMQSKGLKINEIQALAAQKGYSMPDNRNYTEKIASVLDLVFGGGKVGEAIGTSLAKSGITGLSPQERSMVEDGPSAGEVAGSALQSASLFTPVGRLASGIAGTVAKTGLKTGVSAIGKIGSGAVAGGAFDVSQELQDKDSNGVGTAIGAAIPAIGVGVNLAGRVAGKVAPKLLSYTSDVPEKAFESMLSRREPVTSAIKAGATPETALKNTQGAVRQLRTTLSNDWKEGVTAIQNEFTGKRLGLGDKSEASLLKLANEFGFEDRLPQNIKSASITEWMDTLKAINELPKLMLSMSPKGAKLRETQNALKQAVTKTFGGEKGSVAQLYKNYAAKKSVFDAANDIVNAYTTGKPIRQSTALNRLQTLFNENKPAYLEAILDLEKTTGRDLLSEITASKFANKLPTMGSSVSATSGILAPTGILDKVTKLLLLPLSSPRSAGFITRSLSKVKSPSMPKGISPGDRILDSVEGLPNKQGGFIKTGQSIPKDLEPLATEARKYKSAEEFVKAQTGGETKKLNWNTIPQEGTKLDIPLNKLRVSSEALDTATKNVKRGDGSRTEGAIDVVMLKDGTFAIEEGHHRAVQKALQGDKKIKATVYSSRDSYGGESKWSKLDTTFSKEKDLTKSQLTDLYNKATGKK